MSALLTRRELVATALARWTGVPFAWGRADCVQLAAGHLLACGVEAGLARGGRYTTAIGAKRALGRAGFASIEDALAGVGLAEIAPLAALPGDLHALPSDVPGLSGIMIDLGHGAAFGWTASSDGARAVRLHALGRAWRVPA